MPAYFDRDPFGGWTDEDFEEFRQSIDPETRERYLARCMAAEIEIGPAELEAFTRETDHGWD
jgi:hypothetical protein